MAYKIDISNIAYSPEYMDCRDKIITENKKFIKWLKGIKERVNFARNEREEIGCLIAVMDMYFKKSAH
jgi:hypothetical protein